MSKFYAGIGSRNISEEMANSMQKIARILESKGYTLRSGGAKGSDKAFQRGATLPNREIFKAKDAEPWSYDLVKKYIPDDRPKTFDSWSPYVQSLLARNMMQILGKEGKNPVEFVVCWTPQGDYQTSEVGGTGYALRCALDHDIPIYNLNYPEQKIAFKKNLQKIIGDILLIN